MTYATRIIKAHLDHFLGEGWTVKHVSLPKDHYTITLRNDDTGEEFDVTDESVDTKKEHRNVLANVRLFFNRYPAGDK